MLVRHGGAEDEGADERGHPYFIGVGWCVVFEEGREWLKKMDSSSEYIYIYIYI